MKYVKQIMIIMMFSLIGELVHHIIPLQIPASIYGLVLLFLALMLHAVELSQVKETAGFLITAMPLMFIPAGVRLLESWEELSGILLPVAVITIVSTVLVMGVSGRTTQMVIKGGEKRKHE